MTSLISGCAETSANFAGGQTLRSGGLCSMSAVRQSPPKYGYLGTMLRIKLLLITSVLGAHLLLPWFLGRQRALDHLVPTR